MRVKTYKKGGNLSGGFAFNGGSLTGPLFLSGSSEEALEAISKQYVDYSFVNLNANNVKLGTFPVSSLPAFTGDISKSVGSATISLAEINNNVGDVTKVTVNAAGQVIDAEPLVADDIPGFSWNKITQNKPTTLSGYGITDALSSEGGEVNGRLSCSVLPTESMHAVNRQYADTVLASGTGVSIGDIVRKPTKVTPNGFLKANGGKVLVNDYPTLYSVIGDKFNTEMQIGNGKPWEQQSEFNESVQNDIGPWIKEAGLPGVSYAGNLVVTKNRVYLAGGWNGSTYISTVYTAPINLDGTLGSWTTGPSLPVVMYTQEMVVIKNKIYIFGGFNTTLALATVYSANIDAAGIIGSWVTETSLPGPLGGCKAIITKNRIYLCGGRTSASVAGNSSIVYTAAINENGSLGSWSVTTSLPIVLYGHQIVQIKNRVYLIGGQSSTSDMSTIYLAYINDDGTLGNWVTYSSFPTIINAVKVITTKNTMYIFGGAMNNIQSNQLYSCTINSDGSLGTFIRRSDIPIPTNWHLAFITSSRIYLVAGHNGTAFDNLIYSAPFAGGLNDYSKYYDFDEVPNYLEPGSGRPWEQQYQINNTQTDDINDWSFGTAFPIQINVPACIVTKNRVYILGGISGTTTISTGYTAPINSDGTLGAWVAAGSLPTIRHYPSVIVTKNRVYIIGGHDGTSTLSTIITANINFDGTLGTWSATTSLPVALYGSSVFVTKNRVYVCGGYNGTAYVATVYTAPINFDGTLGTWTTGTSLPGILYGSSQIVTNNRVYLLGGYNGTAVVSTVYTALINSDGTLGTWGTHNNIPMALQSMSIMVTENRAYLIGGWNGSANVSTVYTAMIYPGGSLGLWMPATSIKEAHHWMGCFATSSKIYLIGGYVNGTTSSNTVQVASFEGSKNDYSSYYSDDRPNYMEPGSGQPWRQQYQINETQSTDITGWSAGTSLPGILHATSSIVTKNRVYLLGGYLGSGTVVSTVYTAPINSDGTLGTWTTSTPLPSVLMSANAIVVKNRVYLIGGAPVVNSFTNTIYTATINSDGTLGAWSLYGNLPYIVGVHSLVVTKNRLFILGGATGPGTSSANVYSATINIDGTLGSWVASTSLPVALYGGYCFITKNKLYYVGGSSGSNSVATVYSAIISDTGYLGAWSTETSMPGVSSLGNIFVTKNRVYIFGGVTSSIGDTAFATVYTALINSDGSLGTWSTGAPLATKNHSSGLVATSSKIYLCSGQSPSAGYTSAVQVASITGGLNDYSQYYQEDTNNYMEPGSGRPWEQQYQINEVQSNAITGWTLESPLPTVNYNSQVIVTKNRVYLFGGTNASVYISSVYTASINTDGSLGSWVVTTSLPATLGLMAAITIKNRVYLFGGYNGSSAVSTVYTAPINDDGTLGTWAAGPSLPVKLYGVSAVVTKTRVYIIGGYNGTASVNTTYHAIINSDGTLGAWVSGSLLPVGIHYTSSAITKNRIYILAGYTTASVSNVYTAIINSDGIIMSWQTATSLPIVTSSAQILIIKNNIYLISSIIYCAPINPDGTIGTWVSNGSFPIPIRSGQVINTSSKFYIIGGHDGTNVLSTVYSASFSGGLNDYSTYYKKEDQVAYFYLPNETNREIFNLTSYIKY